VLPRVKVNLSAFTQAVASGDLVPRMRVNDGRYGFFARHDCCSSSVRSGDEILAFNGSSILTETIAGVAHALNVALSRLPFCNDAASLRIFRRAAAGAAQPDGTGGSGAAETPLAVALTRATVLASHGAALRRRNAFAAGRMLWSDAETEKRRQRLAQLDAAPNLTAAQAAEQANLLLALSTQAHTRAVSTAGLRVLELVEAGEPGSHWDALLEAYEAWEHAVILHSDPGRVSADEESRRRKTRLMDKVVGQLRSFISGSVPSDEKTSSPAVPVVVLGAWKPKKSPAGFSWATLRNRLSADHIVVLGNEHGTTLLCSACGNYNGYPIKLDGRKHAGTVRCVGRACTIKQSYQNRDVGAAFSILNKFLYRFFIGGELGGCLCLCVCVRLIHQILLFISVGCSGLPVVRGVLTHRSGWFSEFEARADRAKVPTLHRRLAFSDVFKLPEMPAYSPRAGGAAAQAASQPPGKRRKVASTTCVFTRCAASWLCERCVVLTRVPSFLLQRIAPSVGTLFLSLFLSFSINARTRRHLPSTALRSSLLFV
jgi:hypothetical protein